MAEPQKALGNQIPGSLNLRKCLIVGCVSECYFGHISSYSAFFNSKKIEL